MNRMLALAALMTTTFSGSVNAEESNSMTVREIDVERRVVSLEGLDLTRPAGAATAYRRIETAAHGVCRYLEPTMPSTHRALWRHCVTSSIAQAVAEVNAPVLTKYSASRLPQTPKTTTVAAR